MYAVHMNLKHTVCPSLIVTLCKSPVGRVEGSVVLLLQCGDDALLHGDGLSIHSV